MNGSGGGGVMERRGGGQDGSTRLGRRRYDHLVDILANMPDGVVAVNRTWLITYANAAAEQAAGAPRGGLTGKNYWEAIPDVRGTDFETELRRAMDDRVTVRRERFCKHAGRWFEMESQPLDHGGIAVCERDVTHRKQAEAALHESDERFRRTFELGLIGMAITTPSKAFLEVNDELCKTLGYPREELLRMTWAELTHPDDLADDVAQFERVLSGQIDGYTLDKRWIRKDGRVIDSTISMKCRRRDEGTVDYFISLLEDTTERKRVERALRDADRAKSSFLAMLSHELRNPLEPIKNSLLTLERASGGGNEGRMARAVLKRQVDQLSRLVDDLLDLTRISNNKVQLSTERLDLGKLVTHTLADYRAHFKDRGIRLQLMKPRAPIYVQADKNRLAQALGNLLQNASRFVPPGGATTVRVARARTGAHRAVLSVTDDGMGVSAEMLPRIFQPFVQADDSLARSKGGLGLGLALVKAIVELHAGEISAHSPGLGRGTSFVLRLPHAPAPPPRARAPRTKRRREGCRVLIIDDNIDAAESLRLLLQMTSGRDEITLAHTGPQGLRRARLIRPDIVLCDIGLPGMDGYEVARALRSEPTLGRTHLAAVSGYAQPADVQRALKAGFEWHLAKPLDLDRLQTILRSVADEVRASS